MKIKAAHSIQSYLRQVKPYLADCPSKTRRQLLSGLSQELEEYAVQHPTVSLEELSARFRLPEETAQELLLGVPLPVQAASRQLKLLRLRAWLRVTGTWLFHLVFLQGYLR